MDTESVTLTITACRRYELFERTVQSFLRHCTDHHLVRRWICVDDNSSEADRERMSALHHFEYVWKRPSQKGHARSMNMLRALVDEEPTEFVLHLEDDWEFFESRPLVSDALSVLRQVEGVGQVLFNRDYAEEPGARIAESAVVREVPGVHPSYVEHEHDRSGGDGGHSYWPHYSLRPSVLRTRVWRELGRFDEAPGVHFELDYATRYRDAGWRSAFLDGVCCRHIGRRTFERDDPSKPNAYALNRQRQFGLPAAAPSSVGAIPRTIHQIWLGPDSPPMHLIEGWRRMHPDWEHRLWTDADVPRPLVNQEQYDAMGELCGKADILRYELLHRHGGVYLDADLECVRPLPESLLDDPCFTAYESEEHRPGVVANGVIGSVPGHPLIAAMIGAIGRLEPTALSARVAAWTTGTYAFTPVAHAHAGTVTIHPSALFYPDHYEGPGRAGAATLARHDWFFGSPTVCLAAVVDGHERAVRLRTMRPHVNCYAVVVVSGGSSAAVEECMAGVQGTILDRPDASPSAAWTEALDVARSAADVIALGPTEGFRRPALRPDVDAYLASGEVRAVRAAASWTVTGATLALPRLSSPGARVAELALSAPREHRSSRLQEKPDGTP